MKKILIFILLCFALILNAEYIEKTYYFENYQIHQQDGFDLIQFENAQLSAPIGKPVLPYRALKLLLPPGKIADSIELIAADEIELGSNYRLYPSQPSRPLSEGRSGGFMIDETLYRSNIIYPENAHGHLTTQFLHGHPIAFAAITPVKYIPVSGRLSFSPAITVRIHLQDDPFSERKISAGYSSHIIKKLKNYIQNPESINSFSPLQRDDDYQVLIITSSQFVNSFQTLIEINMQRGLKTEIIDVNSIYTSVTGQDEQEKIRNFIIQQYQDFAIQHVVLGGDVEVVPYRGFYCYVQSGNGYESFDIPADLYYAALDGTWDDNNNGIWGEIGEEDLLPELAVARLPFSTQSELNKMLNKTIMYQTQPVLGELTNPLLAGENLYNNPLTWGGDYLDLLIGYQNENGYETTGIPSDDDYLTMYDRDLGSWSTSDLINQINLGHPFIYHCGHSNYDYCMRLSNSHITNSNFSLVNGSDHNFTLIYSHGCNAGGFDQADCIAEEMLKIDNFAAVYIGSSRYGWFNEGQTEGPSAHLNREFVDALYNDEIYLIGETNKNSKIDTAPWVTAPGQWEEGALRWTFYGTNVLGDAALPIWTSEPLYLELTCDPVIILGASGLEVWLENNGSGIENINCTLIQNGELISVTATDGTGYANLQFDAAAIVPGEISLFINGYNCLLTEYTLQVIPAGAYVQISDHAIFSGNDDVLEFGENALLSLTVEEIGNLGDVHNLSLSISTAADYITLNDDYEFVGTLAGGSSIELMNAFDFDVSSDVPNEYVFTIDVAINADEGAWSSQLDLIAYAADIHLENVIIDDGNNNVLEPGETALMKLELINQGGAEAYNLQLLLQTSNPFVVLQMLPVQIDSISAEGGSVLVDVCEITLDEAAPLGEIIEFELEITADNGYFTDNDFSLITGLLIEDFESGNFDNFDWTFAGNANWIIDSQSYQGSYSARSGNISHYNQSTLQISMQITEDGEISFWKKVSSEANYDYLKFMIDGSLIDQWSGEVAWSEEVFAVSAGMHTFSWTYSKDQAVSSGDDCAWIDYIIFPPSGIEVSSPANLNVLSSGLISSYPNPFNPSTTISLNITSEITSLLQGYAGQAVNTEIMIYNTKGQKVKTLMNERLPAGQHSVVWDGTDDNGKAVSSGVYFCRLKSGKVIESRRLLMLK